MSVAFVTIATPSHLADAAVLASSIRSAHAPNVFVALVEAGQDLSSYLPGCTLLNAKLCVPPEQWKGFLDRYTAEEVCFALKPYVIRHLLEQGFQQVHYVDSDILFYADIEPLVEALTSCDLLLTPHYLSPLPDDGKFPSALTLLHAGVFNAGYVGVRNAPEGHRFISWWATLVTRYGRLDPKAGTHGDQGWLDLVPVLFPNAGILRHQGANVGYWNLHERELRHEAGRYTVGEGALLFFHFSGFDPHNSTKLSRHQNRIELRSNGALLKLTTDYAALLLSADYDKWRKIKYSHYRWWHSDRDVIRKLRNWYFR